MQWAQILLLVGEDQWRTRLEVSHVGLLELIELGWTTADISATPPAHLLPIGRCPEEIENVTVSDQLLLRGKKEVEPISANFSHLVYKSDKAIHPETGNKLKENLSLWKFRVGLLRILFLNFLKGQKRR